MTRIIIYTVLALVWFVFLYSVFYDPMDPAYYKISPQYIVYKIGNYWDVARSMFTFSEEGKIQIKIESLDKKLAEIERLKSQKDVAVDRVNQLVEEYNNLQNEVNQDIQKVQDAKQSVDDLLSKLKAVSDAHQQTIEYITNEAPQKASDLLQKASDLLK